MKILMYRWKAYNQQDIVNILEARGHEVEIIRGEMASFEYDPGFESKIKSRLEMTHYDMVFSVNYFPIISDACEERGIPYVSWCCDSPISTMYNQSVFNSVNTIFTFDKVDQLFFEDMGANVIYLPLCGNPDRSDKTISECMEPEKYDADISFIGSMYNKNTYDEIYEHMPEYMKGYFDAALKMQMHVYGRYLLDDVLDGDMLTEISKHFVLAKTERSFSDLSLIFSTTVLSFKIAQLERQSVISELSAKYDVKVYTDESEKFLRAKNCGFADYWREAPVVFNRSKINLNLTLRSIRSGIPLRVWDILSAGGFCITNYQPELQLFFVDGRDLVWFKSREEMEKKIKYYLEHEDERRAIARNGYELVKKYHDYTSRIDTMAEIDYLKEL